MKFKVGLTGGIASGKTHVSDQLSLLGAHVIDADVLAREVVAKGSDGLSQVVKVFGQQVLTKEGSLNRSVLKTIVFNDRVQLGKLNEILHPLIKLAFLHYSEQSSNSFEVWVVPLLYKNSGYDGFDRLLVVDVAPQVQLSRVMSRDGVNAAVANSIVKSQPSRIERLKMATDVIVNNKSFESLNVSIKQVFKLLDKMRLDSAVQIKSCTVAGHQL